MKKQSSIFTAVTCTALLALSSPAEAQTHYRGFVDANFGLCVGRSGMTKGFEMYKSGSEFTLLGTTTHGVQLNDSWFVGGGIGVTLYENSDWKDGTDKRKFETSYSIPIFAAGRWELAHSRKVTPFVDLKIGYSIRSDKYRGLNIISPGEAYPDCRSTPAGSFFIQPTAGVRVAVSQRVGLNFGLTYFPERYKFSKSIGDTYSEEILGHYTRNNLLLNVGVDF